MYNNIIISASVCKPRLHTEAYIRLRYGIYI